MSEFKELVCKYANFLLTHIDPLCYTHIRTLTTAYIALKPFCNQNTI